MNLYPWQRHEVDTYALHPKRAIHASPRTGKTLAAIESAIAADRRKLIVVAPLTVCPMWAEEFTQRGYTVVNAYELPRPQALSTIRKLAPWVGKYVVVIGWRRIGAVTSIEKRERRKSVWLAALLDYNADGLILDEAHNMASNSSTQTKAARKLAKAAPWVRELTGTPAPNNYGSLFPQLMALNDAPIAQGGFGNNWETLAQMYLVRDTVFRSKVLAHYNTDDLTRRMRPYVTTVRREDVFGPDAWVEDEVLVDLPPVVRKQYDTLAHDWLIAEENLNVTADHVLTRLMRLHQMACGFVTDDSGQSKLLHTAILDPLMHDLENVVASGEKAIVFHRYRWEGEEIARRAGGLGVPILRLYGDTPPKERATIIERMAQPEAAIAVVQVQSGGVGVSFARVAYQFVVSQTYSYIDAEQSRDRTYAPGEQRFVRYYRARDTVAVFIAQLLASKRSINDAIKNVDREILAFGKLKTPKLTRKQKAIA